MIVYVWGNLTANNFGPRLGRDMIGGPGQKPGLSAWMAPRAGRKVQGIELDDLPPTLRAFFDEPVQGGTEGHLVIAPIDQAGEVDMQALENWASCRETGRTHPLSQALLDAVVRPNFWSEK